MAERTFPGQPAQLETLIDINIQDFLVSLGIQNINRGRGLVRLLCWLPAWSFARRMAEFDRRVGQLGLGQGGRLTLEDYVASLEVVGGENLPESGPLLVLSNHPGMSDTLALFASLPRRDLKIVAAERPFLNALGNVSRHLIYVPEDASQRMGVVRSAVAHLRHGGAVLTFPAGEIEPDPACMPGAVDSLSDWSESVAVIARLAPETRISVAIVSGVIWPASLRHPLTRLRKERKAQEGIAASLQILAQTLLPSFKPVRVRVAFSPVFPAGELASQGAKALMEAVTGQARGLIQEI